jgi:integral membrane protein (TIGR01906 family)
VKTSTRERLATAIVAVSTPWVVVAAAVLLFLNPIWVGFEQARSDVTGWTGYSEAQVRDVTGSILSDLVFGPPRFDVAVDGVQVLDAGEISHMADVRKVLLSLGLVALLALVALVAAGILARGRRWFWLGVRDGAAFLIGGVVVVGAGFAIFFDQAFLLFHDIFFAPGTFSFDPHREKLVQLFPDQFWSDTSVGIALAVLVLAVAVFLLARRLERRSAGREAVA